MKITIEKIPVGSEPEIIIRCNEVDESLLQLIDSIKSKSHKLSGTFESQIYILEPRDVYYFEAVDNKVFIYCKDKVYESKMKLYEIETEFELMGFFRASKSIVLNIDKIESLQATFNGRFEALLQNQEKVIISRQFIPVLRKKLGL